MPETNTEDHPVTFTQEQVNEIVGKRIEAHEKRLKASGTLSPEERVELEALRKEREERTQKDLERKGEYQKALDLQRETMLKDLDAAKGRETALQTRYRDKVIAEALVTEAANRGALNPDQVRQLLLNHVKLDDDMNPIVLDAKGQPRFKSGADAGQPMALGDLVSEFLAANPHFVRNVANQGGSGAKGGQSGTTGTHSTVTQAQAALETAEAEYARTKSPEALLRVRKASEALRMARASA